MKLLIDIIVILFGVGFVGFTLLAHFINADKKNGDNNDFIQKASRIVTPNAKAKLGK